MQRFRDLFAGSSVRRIVRGTNKPIFQWSAGQLLALRCVTTLAPALRIKRSQAEVAVGFIATFRREKEAMSALNDSHWRRKRLRLEKP